MTRADWNALRTDLAGIASCLEQAAETLRTPLLTEGARQAVADNISELVRDLDGWRRRLPDLATYSGA